MTDSPADPIRKTVIVPLNSDEAFRLYTEGMDSWWPTDTHSLAAAGGAEAGRAARVRVEPRVGGRVLEIAPDGSEAPWATITHWEPGKRFAISWYVGRTPDDATAVDVRFTATEAGTRVDLVHSGFEIFGERAGELHANYTTGWDRVLVECYGGACQAMSA